MIVVIIKMKAIQNIVRIVDLSQSLKYWLKVSFPFLASTFLRGDGSRHSYHVVPLMLATDPKFMFFFFLFVPITISSIYVFILLFFSKLLLLSFHVVLLIQLQPQERHMLFNLNPHIHALSGKEDLVEWNLEAYRHCKHSVERAEMKTCHRKCKSSSRLLQSGEINEFLALAICSLG